MENPPGVSGPKRTTKPGHVRGGRKKKRKGSLATKKKKNEGRLRLVVVGANAYHKAQRKKEGGEF